MVVGGVGWLPGSIVGSAFIISRAEHRGGNFLNSLSVLSITAGLASFSIPISVSWRRMPSAAADQKIIEQQQADSDP